MLYYLADLPVKRILCRAKLFCIFRLAHKHSNGLLISRPSNKIKYARGNNEVMCSGARENKMNKFCWMT